MNEVRPSWHSPVTNGERICLGRLDGLRIAAFGDGQPRNPGERHAPETAQVFAAAAASYPDVLLFLGDAMNASPPQRSVAMEQLRGFTEARAAYDGPFFAVLGNHEAYGENLQAWTDSVQRAVFYEVAAETDVGELRILAVADNIRDPTQAEWLSSALARPAAITIVAKHYPLSHPESPQPDLEEVIRAAGPSLVLSGHTHAYRHRALREVVAGTGGAALASASDFHGYLLVSTADGGGLSVEMHRLDGTVADSFLLP